MVTLEANLPIRMFFPLESKTFSWFVRGSIVDSKLVFRRRKGIRTENVMYYSRVKVNE